MEQVRKWFLENRRVFPWREEKNPYAVLVSEIMLQQTRAIVVVPYFEKWMKKFPNLEALSRASEEEVIKLWEGLGYYSRARNLLALSKLLVHQNFGNIPQSYEELLRLKGIGHYTAGAIVSFGYGKKEAALDGNVIRVITRLVAFEKQANKEIKTLRKIVYDFLPDVEPEIVMEGLIELGATICMKKPLCQKCPLKTDCLAFKNGNTEKFPLLPKKKKITKLFRFVGCITFQNEYLVKLPEKGKIMSSLYEFPYIEAEEDFIFTKFQKKIENQLGLRLKLISPLKKEKHHFTRYQADLFPFHFEAIQKKEITGCVWVSKNTLFELAFSAGHRRIKNKIDF
ncbi:MAG: A/G-specific adenine glycosylase [Chlamydiae bacterium]|nr:A/G-specific adenine glycosylase [Chlamydiota bacterium]